MVFSVMIKVFGPDQCTSIVIYAIVNGPDHWTGIAIVAKSMLLHDCSESVVS